jgi:hypothetical protein
VRGEFLPPRLAEGKPPLEDLAVADIALACGEIHDGAECGHLVADGTVADPAARAALAGLLPPGRERVAIGIQN